MLFAGVTSICFQSASIAHMLYFMPTYLLTLSGDWRHRGTGGARGAAESQRTGRRYKIAPASSCRCIAALRGCSAVYSPSLADSGLLLDDLLFDQLSQLQC